MTYCNEERMTRVIKHLELEDLMKFDMVYWRRSLDDTECGSIGCIGGLADALHAQEDEAFARQYYGGYINYLETAQWLGITKECANKIFYLIYDDAQKTITTNGVEIDLYDVSLESISKQQAIEACKNVMEHGDPNWQEVLLNDYEGYAK